MNLDFIQKINRNSAFKYFPELRKLKKVIEKNICHNNESVFDHTMQVFDNCKVILNLLNQNQLVHFDKLINENKTKNLFLVAILFHDLGKFETLEIKNNITVCNNHEKIGAKLLEQTRLNELGNKEFKYIQRIIKNHSLIQLSLDNRNSFNEKYIKLEKRYPNIILEMTILGIADIYNGDLKKNDKQEYKYRIKKLSNKLKVGLLK